VIDDEYTTRIHVLQRAAAEEEEKERERKKFDMPEESEKR
jgi:hypothetical protein